MADLLIGKASYPAIQGLVILAGRDCAVGNWSQGWLYLGMAIRMVQDSGMHLRVVGKNAEEKLVRLRLAWSVFWYVDVTLYTP